MAHKQGSWEKPNFKVVHVIAAVLATATLLMFLYLWRIFYPVSDWAIIFLLALAFLVFAAVFSPTASKYRARLRIEINETSPLSGWLTGRIHAGFVALAFTGVAMPVLAWQALTASWAEVMGFIALSVVSGSVMLRLYIWLGSHLSAWLARSAAITLAACAVGLIFIPLIIWINWGYAAHPGGIRIATLSQAVMISIDELPSRRGWIAEMLSFFYALDGAKLWLVVQLSPSRWATILYSLDASLVGFIVAKASAFLASFISNKIEGLK